MISRMLSRDPNDRPSFDRILTTFRGSIFPEYFYTFLKDYSASLSDLPETIGAAFLQRSASEPGTKVNRLLNEWDSISVNLQNPSNGIDESERTFRNNSADEKLARLYCFSTSSRRRSVIASGRHPAFMDCNSF